LKDLFEKCGSVEKLQAASHKGEEKEFERSFQKMKRGHALNACPLAA
jgi:hypothetical protein